MLSITAGLYQNTKPTFAEMQENTTSTEKILSYLKIDSLNEMQEAMLDAVAANEQVVLVSPTGSGKTLAFLLPLLQLLDRSCKDVQALVLVP